MEVKASTNFLRIAPRKVRLVIDAVRGQKIDQAIIRLRFIEKAAAEPVLKLLKSAVDNARQKGLDVSTLVVKEILANQGPIMYRYRPRAMGRATPIRKRTTHVNVVLEGKELAAPKKEEKPKAAKAPAKAKAAKK
jgi:large subunit ribosomal protein L22